MSKIGQINSILTEKHTFNYAKHITASYMHSTTPIESSEVNWLERDGSANLLTKTVINKERTHLDFY